MEHVEEIGSSLRHYPLAPWHLFGPNRFLRDLVMREPIEKQSRSFEGRSPNCQIERTVTGRACIPALGKPESATFPQPPEMTCGRSPK